MTISPGTRGQTCSNKSRLCRPFVISNLSAKRECVCVHACVFVCVCVCVCVFISHACPVYMSDGGYMTSDEPMNVLNQICLNISVNPKD